MHRDDDSIDELLRTLDHPTPAVTAQRIVARVRRSRRIHVRRAALVLFALGVAGVAVAAPGSALRAWVVTVSQRIIGSPSATAPATPSSADSSAGIIVIPPDRLIVEFVNPPEGSSVSVALGSDDALTVRATGAGAAFTSEPERLLVYATRANGSFQVHIPRSARYVEIRTQGTTLLTASNGTVVAAVPAEDRGVYLLQLAPARP